MKNFVFISCHLFHDVCSFMPFRDSVGLRTLEPSYWAHLDPNQLTYTARPLWLSRKCLANPAPLSWTVGLYIALVLPTLQRVLWDRLIAVHQGWAYYKHCYASIPNRNSSSGWFGIELGMGGLSHVTYNILLGIYSVLQLW